MRAFIEQHLQPWRLLDEQGKPARNTVTGYYEPLVRGARKQGGAYQWPLYQPPADLLTIDLGSVYPELAGKRIRGKLDGRRVVPYDTRAEIAAKPERQPPAIVWIPAHAWSKEGRVRTAPFHTFASGRSFPLGKGLPAPRQGLVQVDQELLGALDTQVRNQGWWDSLCAVPICGQAAAGSDGSGR